MRSFCLTVVVTGAKFNALPNEITVVVTSFGSF